jgi:hypothetical protein
VVQKPKVSPVEIGLWFVKLHQEVNVTLRLRLAPRHGAKNIEALDP